MAQNFTEFMGYQSPFGDKSLFIEENAITRDETTDQTLISNKKNSANGYYYLYDGSFLMKCGQSNEVVVCESMTLIPRGADNTKQYYLFTRPVRLKLTNAELNFRAVMGVMQTHEGGYGEYYKWNGGSYFTFEEAINGHPGEVTNRTSAAGAYQILLASWNEKYTGAKFRQKYGIKDFLPTSQDKFTVATIKDKITVKAYELISTGQFKKAYEKMAGEWRFIPGKKSQSNVTMEQLLIETNTQIIRELNGLSPIKTPVGELLFSFEN